MIRNQVINSRFLLCGILFFVLILSGCVGYQPRLVVITQAKTATSNLPAVTRTTATTEPTDTSEPTATETKLPTFTVVDTATDTPTANETETPTMTLEPASLTLGQDTACFVGTSFGNDLLAYVVNGARFPILAGIEDQSWWFVRLEEGKDCWIYGEYATVEGAITDIPIITPSPPPSPTATLPPSSYGIYYILIAKDTGGPFGCGDSLIRYYPGIWVNGDMEEDILTALNALFSNHNQYVGDLYNPMYQSQIRAKGVEMVGGEVIVQLNGSLVRPKDSCESQRMRDQVWYTISQFTSTRPIVYLNNALLGDLLVVTNK